MKYPFLAEEDALAVELGHITLSWAKLEWVLDILLVVLVGLHEGKSEEVICGNLELRAKIATIRGLAFIRHEDNHWLSIDWLNSTIELIDYIDHKLRDQRNLFIHAQWQRWSRKSVIAHTKKTKIMKPQSFKRILETDQFRPFQLRQLRRFSENVFDTVVDIYYISVYAMRCEANCYEERPPPKLSFQQYLRAEGHTLRAVRIPPKRKRRDALRPKGSPKGKSLRPSAP